jgi:hypothetical protein
MRGSSAIHGAVDFGIYLSNLRGDGKTEFIAQVESEMKAARGAGVFDRTLKIDDNDKGNAIRAAFAWSEPKADAAGGPKDLAEERAFQVVQKLFDQGAPLSRDQLLLKVKGGMAKLNDAIDIALEEGWIAQKFHGQRAAGFEITESGKKLVRSGSSGDGDPPADEPPAGQPPPTGWQGFLASTLQA